MSSTAPRYSLTELAGLAGVTPRTIRYYLSQGLLPSTGASGPGAKYDDTHLGRLRLIRKLQREHLPLAEIRQRLAGLDDATIASLAEQPDLEPGPQDSALDYIRRVLGPNPAMQAAPFAPTRFASLAGAPPRARSLRVAPPSGAAPPPGMHVGETGAHRDASDAPLPRQPISLGVEPTPDRRFDRSQWERITLAPDIELHVRRPLPRPLSKQVDRLVSIARDLLEEDQT